MTVQSSAEEYVQAPKSPARTSGGLTRFLRENSLSLAIGLLFTVSFVGQVWAGKLAFNDSLIEHRFPPVDLLTYLTSGHVLEAVFESRESEFLQMSLVVLLTLKLRQKGSSESKKLDEPEEVDEDPAASRHDPEAPWPVRRGGLVLALYQHSLSIALGGLFLVSFVPHGVMGHHEVNQEAIAHGEPAQTLLEYVGSAQFWFESFKNWQSESVAVGAIVVLSIWLRQRGSSQSKPVAAPHHQTGS